MTCTHPDSFVRGVITMTEHGFGLKDADRPKVTAKTRHLDNPEWEDYGFLPDREDAMATNVVNLDALIGLGGVPRNA